MELGNGGLYKVDVLKAKSRRRLTGIRTERKQRVAAVVKLQAFARGHTHRKKQGRPLWHGMTSSFSSSSHTVAIDVHEHNSGRRAAAPNVLTACEIAARCAEAEERGPPQMEGAGERDGLAVWRIERFRAVPWPRERFGSFHTGDSYLVLSTRTSPATGERTADLHFWIGACVHDASNAPRFADMRTVPPSTPLLLSLSLSLALSLVPSHSLPLSL